MEVIVVFKFSDINDPNSEEADNIIENLEIDLTNFNRDRGYNWYIEDAIVKKSKG